MGSAKAFFWMCQTLVCLLQIVILLSVTKPCCAADAPVSIFSHELQGNLLSLAPASHQLETNIKMSLGSRDQVHAQTENDSQLNMFMNQRFQTTLITVAFMFLDGLCKQNCK
uniref:Putative secreted protein n=1 Tax=Ixodes ricinus TaxID=34613 RepID=A0A147BAD6_IXORI